MIEIKMQNICVECVMCAICSWMRANNRFQDAAPPKWCMRVQQAKIQNFKTSKTHQTRERANASGFPLIQH